MAINTTFTSGQILTAAQMNNLPWGYISYARDTVGSLFNNLTTVQELFRGPAFTPVAGRVYRVTVTIGSLAKGNNIGNLDVTLRKDSTAGAVIDGGTLSATPLSALMPFTRTVILTSTQMGTTSFTPVVCVQANTAGLVAINSATAAGAIIIEDIGLA